MKTIKIIDLLNYIAKGNLPPEEIKFEDEIYIFANLIGDYYSKSTKTFLLEEYSVINMINKEIEVLDDKGNKVD